jgi:hypothetical protein
MQRVSKITQTRLNNFKAEILSEDDWYGQIALIGQLVGVRANFNENEEFEYLEKEIDKLHQKRNIIRRRPSMSD